MTEAERAVIEAAVEWDDLRRASEFGPVPAETLKRAKDALIEAMVEMHCEHDGRWLPSA